MQARTGPVAAVPAGSELHPLVAGLGCANYDSHLQSGKVLKIMKQLGIDVSPPDFVWNPYLTLTNVTFDLDDLDLEPCHL